MDGITIPFQTRDYRDEINEFPTEEPIDLVWCDTCKDTWWQGEHDNCPGCTTA